VLIIKDYLTLQLLYMIFGGTSSEIPIFFHSGLDFRHFSQIIRTVISHYVHLLAKVVIILLFW